MKDAPLGIRLEPEERGALEKAAASDDRTLSAMARKIITEWLKKRGYLKAPKRCARGEWATRLAEGTAK